MDSSLVYPKLRWPLDLKRESFDTGDAIVIRCPLGISEKPLLLIPEVGPVISKFLGNKSLTDLQLEFEQLGFSQKVLQELVTLLDDHLFLASPRFYAAQESMRLDFAHASVRKAALAGLSYSDNEFQLGREIDTLLAHGKSQMTPVRTKTDLFTLVAPHIDYRRGGVCYGITYEQLRKHEHDIYILIGTSHQYSDLMFHLTQKDFASPLGLLPTDRDFVTRLAQRFGHQRSFADEILHRREHSLELQLPFLKRLKEQPTIVPILVGSFHQMITAGKLPNHFDEYESFAGALAEGIQENTKAGRRVCIIAGVDMAHVGQYFGDPEKLTPQFMNDIRERDQKYLNAIVKQDKLALFSNIVAEQDARKVCGFPTMYTVLDVMERLGLESESEVFDYRQAVDYQSDCAVTFAGMGMYI